MKILVTGGAGFIGSALIRHIIDDTDHTVLNMDKLTYAGNLENVKSVANNERYSFAHVDICDEDKVSAIFEEFKPDIVMHLAAESHVDRSIDGASEFIKTNILGTYNLLECARRYWKKHLGSAESKFRFHHVSTDEVYGDLERDSEALFTESTPYAPSSPYSASKASSDHLVRAWHRTYDFPVLITNCSNNYGPYHYPEKLIPLVILKALKGERLPVYGDGQQIRDWLYVDDHVKALLKVACDGKVGETYNIGGCNEVKNIDVVLSVCSILEGLNLPKPEGVKNYKDLIEFVADRPGHDERYAIDATKIINELGWKPVETFDSGLKKTVKWFVNNQ